MLLNRLKNSIGVRMIRKACLDCRIEYKLTGKEDRDYLVGFQCWFCSKIIKPEIIEGLE